MNYLRILVLRYSVLFFFSSTTYSLSSKEARKKLAEQSIVYDEFEFRQWVEKGNIEAVNLFLVAGMNPNIKTIYVSTVLMEAVWFRNRLC